MIAFRKDVQKPVVIRLIAMLQRIDEDKTPTGLQYARTFAKNATSHLWRQFVEHEYACKRVSALISNGQRLRLSYAEFDLRPVFQLSLCVFDIGFRHINPEDRQPRPNLLNRVEKSSRPATDVHKAQFALVAASKHFVELREGLPSYRIG